MSEVWFYHLQRAPLESALPKLIELTLQRGWRAIVRSTSDDRVEFLNGLLWTFSQNAFIPHGSRADGSPDRQPVYLTHESENPNAAHVLFLVDGAQELALDQFERTMVLFDGTSDDIVSEARAYWSSLKERGFSMKYWQQDTNGKWEEAG